MYSAATILIVDDEEQNRKLLELMLEPEGYRTLTAADAAEALAMISRNEPDLILLDVMMPGTDGYELARILKSSPDTANIPIIMVSAHLGRGALVAGLDSGAEEFLTKPVDRTELWLRVRNLLRLKQLAAFYRNHGALLETQVQARTADLHRYRAAMNATADSITMVSRKTMRFVEANASACALFGYSRDELLQMSPALLSATPDSDFEVDCDAVIDGAKSGVLIESSLVRRDGSTVSVEMQRHAYQSGDDSIIVAIMRDVTQRKEAEAQLHRLAHFDSLTGLPNRAMFHETLEKTLDLATTRSWSIAVFVIDIDDFKEVNRLHGHAIGDELLREIGFRLASCVFVRDTIARLGGDEFGVIVVMRDCEQAAALVADKFRRALLDPFEVGGHAFIVTASIGISIHPTDATDAQALLRLADVAMYRAKQAGRNTFRSSEPGMDSMHAREIGQQENSTPAHP